VAGQRHTYGSKEVELLKREIAILSAELEKALEDSVYMSMTASQNEVYEGKRVQLTRLKEELTQQADGQPNAPKKET
jgi:hypothetical protein